MPTVSAAPASHPILRVTTALAGAFEIPGPRRDTGLNDGVLLCPYHHHKTHDPAYATNQMPNGDHRFNRRT